ncbi:MAG TPA: tetratricopeptide repeat protein, partial [Rhizobacter sp.]
MSLLNQVLRDLDQRQAPGSPTPVKAAAPRPLAPSAGQRAMRWGLGALATLAAVVAGGWAQGSIQWPAKTNDTSVVAAVPEAAPVMPVTPTPATAPAPAPVVLPDEPVKAEAAVAVAPAALRAPTAVQLAVVALTPRSKPLAAPQPSGDTPPATTAKAEPRIELRSAARSPQERAEAQYQRGVTAHQAGQINDSALAFNAALREDPQHAAARVAQAGLLIGQSRPDEAMALLKEGLALAPA